MEAIGFDVYGTLVDPQSMQEHLRAAAGERAPELARTWRLRAAWIRRSPQVVFDAWGSQPDLTVCDLAELAARFPAR